MKDGGAYNREIPREAWMVVRSDRKLSGFASKREKLLLTTAYRDMAWSLLENELEEFIYEPKVAPFPAWSSAVCAFLNGSPTAYDYHQLDWEDAPAGSSYSRKLGSSIWKSMLIREAGDETVVDCYEIGRLVKSYQMKRMDLQ